MGLRAEIEKDLAETLEDPADYGIPVVLITPTGEVISTSLNKTGPLYGQVLYDSVKQDEDGMQIIDNKPVVTLRRSSLVRTPQSGEVWGVQIPTSPLLNAPIETFLLERAIDGGSSLGIIRLHLTKAAQS